MRCLTLFAAVLALAPGLAWAQVQDFPTRPITVIVPFPAGGPTDTIARVTAQSMSKLLGQQVIVENVSGAGGTLGAGQHRADRAPNLATPEALQKHLLAEVDRWAPIIKASGEYAD